MSLLSTHLSTRLDPHVDHDSSAAISDDESDGDVPEEIPAKAVKAPDPMEEDEDEDEDEEDDSEEAEDEYVVENILKHRNNKGTLQYRIKWLGYDDEADITWEPLENLKTASVKLSEYHDRIGGPPTKAAAASSAKKSLITKRSASALDTPAPATKKSRTSTGAANSTPSSSKDLPKGSWEDNITRIISIIEESETTKSRAGGGKVLMAYADWKDNVKRKHKGIWSLGVTRTPQRPKQRHDLFKQWCKMNVSSLTSVREADKAPNRSRPAATKGKARREAADATASQNLG
ncbi:hypothetical protein B0A48_15635 [Cryoendolithus antarcticus]|uniref:Chromo domain-containing protein n=1 Tax=Cryoendolithus antarcticus TaxID=1507870 RepID=A0A1V8SH64_9PEZI|nr:hypothetical protein B0A48_15635 [Cryoendolithus antarcticus]